MTSTGKIAILIVSEHSGRAVFVSTLQKSQAGGGNEEVNKVMKVSDLLPEYWSEEMMKSRIKFGSLLAISLIVLFCRVLSASPIYTTSIDLFTDDYGGGYLNNPDVKFRMEISNGGPTVTFKFFNDSTVDCTIGKVFFDDGTLLGISGVTNGPGVLYEYPSPGENFPAGGTLVPPFETTENFSAVPEPPPAHNGIDDGLYEGVPEWLEIHYDLQYLESEGRWGNLNDVISELRDGTLRVGIHVLSFPDGSSQSGINSRDVVPEPASICALGMGALFLLRKRRNRR